VGARTCGLSGCCVDPLRPPVFVGRKIADRNALCFHMVAGGNFRRFLGRPVFRQRRIKGRIPTPRQFVDSYTARGTVFSGIKTFPLIRVLKDASQQSVGGYAKPQFGIRLQRPSGPRRPWEPSAAEGNTCLVSRCFSGFVSETVQTTIKCRGSEYLRVI